MAGTTKDVLLDPITEGMISEGVLSHYVSPSGAMSYLENFHNDTLGVLTSRPPLKPSSYNPAALPGSACLYALSTTTAYIVWTEGTTLKYATSDNTGSVNNYTSAASGSTPSRFDTILGKLIITQGSTAQPKFTDLSGAPVSLITSFPATNSMDIISAGFIGRIWGAESISADARVYYSDVIPTGGLGSVTGGASYLTINANNGDKVTALIRTQQCLFVFTNNGIFRIFNTQSQDNTPIVNVGTPRQESVVQTKDGYYFFHATGIYKLGIDGSVQEISTKIRPILARISPFAVNDVIGWADKDHVYFSLGKDVGNLDPDGKKSWTVRYTISTQVWTLYSFYDFLPSCVASSVLPDYVSTAQISPFPTTWVFGSLISNASSYSANTFDSPAYTTGSQEIGVNGDLGTYKIYCKAITNWKTFGKEPHYKRVNGFTQAHENASGFVVDYVKDKDNPSVWQNVGNLDQDQVKLFRDFQSDEFNKIKFRVQGETLGSIVTIGQMGMVGLDDLGYKNN